MTKCRETGREQGFTRPKTQRTNGKAERVIRMIMEQLSEKTEFQSSAHRKNELRRFVNWYNWVERHEGTGNLAPGEKLLEYFYPEKL